MSKDKWRLSEYDFESFSHYLNNSGQTLKLQEVLNLSRKFWYGFSDSNVTEYIQHYQSLSQRKHFIHLMGKHEVTELSEEFIIPLPFILQIWQILKENNYYISFMNMLDHSTLNPIEKIKAKEITTKIDGLDIDLLFDYFQNKWTPGKSYLCDICVLYSIWTLLENNRTPQVSVCCKVLEIISAECSFLTTMLACLCLKSDPLRNQVSSFSSNDFPLQNFLFCEFFIKAYTKDIYIE